MPPWLAAFCDGCRRHQRHHDEAQPSRPSQTATASLLTTPQAQSFPPTNLGYQSSRKPIRCSTIAILDSANQGGGGLRINGLTIARWMNTHRFTSNHPRQAPNVALVFQNNTTHARQANGTTIQRSTMRITTISTCTGIFTSLTRSLPTNPSNGRPRERDTRYARESF